MECARAGCHASVDNEGLAGFCADHKVEAVFELLEGLGDSLAELERQTTTIATELRHLMIDLGSLRAG